jgi:hypothetical protein
MAYGWDEETMYATVFNYGTFAGELHWVNLETGKFTFIARLKGGAQTTCFAILGGQFGCDVYIPCGTEEIKAVIANLGTFPERDMTCHVVLNEYITNCTVGTEVYNNTITNIDVLTPLVGEKELNFGSYNFATEGFYATFFELFDDDDDYPDNNLHSCGIGVDCTPPVSSHTLDPPNPDGLAGWYVSDVDVTLSATDPGLGCERDGAGVAKIDYTVNGVPGSVPGEGGTFTVHDDGEGIVVEYWATDWVGNAEAKHTFLIDMDQNKPVVDVRYDAAYDGDIKKWFVTFTANATDDMSDMHKVVMYINDGFHEEVVSSGPVYEFVIEWSESFRSVMFRFEAHDIAGWTESDEYPGDQIESVPVLKSESQPKQKTQPLPK